MRSYSWYCWNFWMNFFKKSENTLGSMLKNFQPKVGIQLSKTVFTWSARPRTWQLALPGRLKKPHNYFISHFHTLGKFSFLDSLSALKNPVFVLKIFKILKILISVINIWKLWTEAARYIIVSLTHTHTWWAEDGSWPNTLSWNLQAKKAAVHS